MPFSCGCCVAPAYSSATPAAACCSAARAVEVASLGRGSGTRITATSAHSAPRKTATTGFTCRGSSAALASTPGGVSSPLVTEPALSARSVLSAGGGSVEAPAAKLHTQSSRIPTTLCVARAAAIAASDSGTMLQAPPVACTARCSVPPTVPHVQRVDMAAARYDAPFLACKCQRPTRQAATAARKAVSAWRSASVLKLLQWLRLMRARSVPLSVGDTCTSCAATSSSTRRVAASILVSSIIRRAASVAYIAPPTLLPRCQHGACAFYAATIESDLGNP